LPIEERGGEDLHMKWRGKPDIRALYANKEIKLIRTAIKAEGEVSPGTL